MFPKGSPPAKRLDAVDLTSAPRDTQLAATTLQGRVNAGPEAKVYLLIGHWDAFWLAHLAAKGYIEGHDALTVEAYFAKYGGRYTKAILYDEHVPASVNVGTMMASLDAAIVIAPVDAGRFAKDKAREDLRGRWRTNAEAYQWAFDTLWPRMNHHLLACYHPTGLPHLMRDYFVRNKVFHFWVTSAEKADNAVSAYEEETAFLKRLLAATPVNIPVTGFWYSGVDPGINEYAGVGLAGEYGKFTVCCDYASNLSILSGIEADLDGAVARYRARLKPPGKTLDKHKVYLCIDIVESGDAASYLQNRQFEVWADPKRGEIPINWSMGAGAFEMEPPIAEYYFDQATPNDYIYMALSGAGYCHPYRAMMSKTPGPEQAWDEYIQLTGTWMRQMGCHEIGLYTNAWKPFDRARHDAVTKRFADGIPGLSALVLGMGRDEGMNALNGNYVLGERHVAVSHVLTRWPLDYATKTREENVAWLVQDIREQTPAGRPAFMHAMALSWAFNPSDIVEVYGRLGESYEVLTLPGFTYAARAAGLSRPR